MFLPMLAYNLIQVMVFGQLVYDGRSSKHCGNCKMNFAICLEVCDLLGGLQTSSEVL